MITTSPKIPSFSALLSLGICLWAQVGTTRPPGEEVKTKTGAFIIERPTLISIGFAWKIRGDSNRNAKVEVEYRKKGEAQWHQALPLFRSQNEKLGTPPPGAGAYANGAAKTIAPNHFAGSIFNLDPGTTYEAKLTLSDPDGVVGESTKMVTVTTRKEPMPAVGGKTYHVYPSGYKGSMQEPGFLGLMNAYNTGASGSDHVDAYVPRVRPGDIILVHAGLYKDCRERYGGCALPEDPGREASGKEPSSITRTI